MQIICISRYSYSYGKELAEKLAVALDYQCVSREEITNEATAYGIPVGKLETAILKRQLISEELANEIEHFKAFITIALCKKAQSGGIVYHGRIGHMVLQGINHVLKVRVCANEEDRIKMVMKRMKLTHKLATEYINQVDEDRCRYAKFFYNVNCNDPILFDVVINLSHLPIEDSISALCKLVQLPEFQSTPSSLQKVSDLHLQSNCRLKLSEDERTRNIKFNISSVNGNVSITYLPTYEKQAEAIPLVLEKMKGLRSIVCTMATTNILYIQERFNIKEESFEHLLEIAGKWNASVEPIRLEHRFKEETNASEKMTDINIIRKSKEVGGILDDTPEGSGEEKDDYGLLETINKLIQVGRAGKANTLYGGTEQLVKTIGNSRGHCLVVIGDVFLSSGSALRKRMKRELIIQLSDHSRVPVISSEDLQEQYLFGPKQKIKTLIYAILTLLIYLLVFTNQEILIKFLSTSGTMLKVLVVILVCLFTAVAAYIISGFSRSILKLMKLE